ncbi:hypothetical protein EN875_012390 [Mesorhizobium sp. M2D.F.Ca.ET.232.01.1.1]|nr:hypothetical protein [Mesorhizobium sp. M2D.F.Ca.ET.232.01.1.1]TGP34042.1 hypothetical protein EN875_012390 [Mesorhizobium sp. M2D.F.Ca.ET.232.01.1.1]
MPGVDFGEMARQAISAKLTEALVGADDAIIKIVATAMATKVNDHGNVSSSSYDNKTPYAEWLAGSLIREATKSVMAAKVAQLRPAIEAQVEKALTKNTRSIAVSLTDNFIKQAAAGYGVVINMTAEMRVRD